jgi:hypothetical protein
MTKKKPTRKVLTVERTACLIHEAIEAIHQRRPETAPPPEKPKPKPKRHQRPPWSPRADATYPTAPARIYRRDDKGWTARPDVVA